MENKLSSLKNIKSLLIATNNKGKLLEINKLLPKHITFYSPKDFNILEQIENSKYFEILVLFKNSNFEIKKKSFLFDKTDSKVEFCDANKLQ